MHTAKARITFIYKVDWYDIFAIKILCEEQWFNPDENEKLPDTSTINSELVWKKIISTKLAQL